MKYLSRSSLLGALGATAALVAVTLARGGDGNVATTTSTTANSSNVSSGMIVAKDAVTGALRAPTAEEIAALQSPSTAKGARKFAEPVRQLPNGTRAITLDSSTEVYSVAAKTSDGKVRTACVPAEKVEATLKAAQEASLTKKDVLDEK